ncbi:unnamed protein product [Schistosoma margrebowiei]|uniref:RRM domain-containing protein n=1 Tax=Schistosoma margrebowiei TaxID=48269 RepID=A0AA85AN11_9TREM|nr:unnamed protein product [Schistosoma margrebowiei]
MFHYKESDPSSFYFQSNKPRNDIQSVSSKTNEFFNIQPLKILIQKNKHSTQSVLLVIDFEQVNDSKFNSSTIQTNNVPRYNTSNSNSTILTTHKLDSSLQSQLDSPASVVDIHDKLNIQSGYESQINESRNPTNLDHIHSITDGQQRYLTEVKLYLCNNRTMNCENYDSENLNNSISERISHVKAVPCKIIHTQYYHSPKVHYPQDISLSFVSVSNCVSSSSPLPPQISVRNKIQDCNLKMGDIFVSRNKNNTDSIFQETIFPNIKTPMNQCPIKSTNNEINSSLKSDEIPLKGVKDCSNSYKDSYPYSGKKSVGMQFKLFEKTQALKEIAIQTTYEDTETFFQTKKFKHPLEKNFVSLNEQRSNDLSFSPKQTPNKSDYNQVESNYLNENIVYVNQTGKFDDAGTTDIDNRTYVCSCLHFGCPTEQTDSTFKSETQSENLNNDYWHKNNCETFYQVNAHIPQTKPKYSKNLKSFPTETCSYFSIWEKVSSRKSNIVKANHDVKHEHKCMEQYSDKKQIFFDKHQSNNKLISKKWDESSQSSFSIMNVDFDKQSCRSNNRKGVVYSNTKKEIRYDGVMDEYNRICTSSPIERKTNSNLLAVNSSLRDNENEKCYILHKWLQEQVAYSTGRNMSKLSEEIPSFEVNRSPTSPKCQILDSAGSKHPIISKDITEKEIRFSNIVSPSVCSLSSTTLSMFHTDSKKISLTSESNDQPRKNSIVVQNSSDKFPIFQSINKYYTTESQSGLTSSNEKCEQPFNSLNPERNLSSNKKFKNIETVSGSSQCGLFTFKIHNGRSKQRLRCRKPSNILSNSLSSSSRLQSKSNSFEVNSQKAGTSSSNHHVTDEKIDQNSLLFQINRQSNETLTTDNQRKSSSISENHLNKTAEILNSKIRSHCFAYTNADSFIEVFELSPYDDLVKSYLNTTDRRIKAIAIKNNCVIKIHGPFTLPKHVKSGTVNLSKIKYECHVYALNEKMLKKCINYIKETFPNSLLHFIHRK